MQVILGTYLGVSPDSLKFVVGPLGKPSLVPEQHGGLEFNLSHSGETALLAVARGRAVGIDIVRHDATVDHAGIASRVFSPGELKALDDRSADGAIASFYQTWARKEAALKARGLGLASGPVADQPGQWETFDIDVGEGYSAALAVARPAGSVELYDFD
jgi:4'-phosphopantetheinyl transferase